MKNNPPNGPVADAVRELVEGMGCSLLEFSFQHVKGRTHVHCVLHGPAGIDIDTLTTIHRALQPRLEESLEDQDLRIEFSSPGVERTLKSFHEFSAFVGREIDYLPADHDDWVRGTVTAFDGTVCTITGPTGNAEAYTAAALTKARLVD